MQHGWRIIKMFKHSIPYIPGETDIKVLSDFNEKLKSQNKIPHSLVYEEDYAIFQGVNHGKKGKRVGKTTKKETS